MGRSSSSGGDGAGRPVAERVDGAGLGVSVTNWEFFFSFFFFERHRLGVGGPDFACWFYRLILEVLVAVGARGPEPPDFDPNEGPLIEAYRFSVPIVEILLIIWRW